MELTGSIHLEAYKAKCVAKETIILASKSLCFLSSPTPKRKDKSVLGQSWEDSVRTYSPVTTAEVDREQ